MTSNEKIQKIQQTLHHLTVALDGDCGLQDFESVEIPFQLTQACIQLWTDCFSISNLQNIANIDPDTLEVWAISLNTTLQIQLGILNQWLPLLCLLSVPPKLREKAKQRTSELDQIANQKSALLQAAPNFLAQETELRHAAAELSNLRARLDELRSIEAELRTTDLSKLRAAVLQKESELLPQRKTVSELNQQKANLETQIASLRQQREILAQEIEQQKLHQERQQSGILTQIHELLNLTETAKAELSIPLAKALENLECQRNEYNQQWEDLQLCISYCNQYRNETEVICADLNAHYQVDVDLGQWLPVNKRQIDILVQSIKENLTQLDRELQTAQAHHERLQQKQYITFGRQP